MAEPVVNTFETVSPIALAYYDRQLLTHAKPVLVHNQFGQKRPIPANSGRKINFRKFSKLPKATTPLTEGVTPTGFALEKTEIEATVNQYGAYVPYTDRMKLEDIDPDMAEVNRLLGMNSGETLDYITAQVLAGGTNVMYAQGGTGRATLSAESNALTLKDIKKAAAILKKNCAQKVDGKSYVAIVHPFVASDLMDDDKWVHAKVHDNKDLYAGEVGTIYGVRVVESSEATIFEGAGANGADVYVTLVIGADAYGVTEITGGGLKSIIKQLGSGGAADPLDQRGSQGWKAIHTAVILNDLNMVRIESAVTLD